MVDKVEEDILDRCHIDLTIRCGTCMDWERIDFEFPLRDLRIEGTIAHCRDLARDYECTRCKFTGQIAQAQGTLFPPPDVKPE